MKTQAKQGSYEYGKLADEARPTMSKIREDLKKIQRTARKMAAKADREYRKDPTWRERNEDSFIASQMEQVAKEIDLLLITAQIGPAVGRQ